MPYDINAALERLEKNLQDLDSARNQVEKTVKANTELQSVVSEYVSSVKTLCVGLQAWEANLRAKGESLSHECEEAISRVNSTCTELIKSFGTVVEQTSTDFKNKTQSIVEIFTEQNRILTERVKNMNALKDEIKKATSEIQSVKDSLTQISKDLTDSQSAQDDQLKTINNQLSSLLTMTTGIGGQATAIQQSLTSQSASLGTLSQSLQTAHTSLSGINALIQKVEQKTIKLHHFVTIQLVLTIIGFLAALGVIAMYL